MKKFFSQNKISVGVVAGLGSELVTALLLWVGLLLANEPTSAHIRWFAAIFIPILLILRYYIKKTTCQVVIKTLMTVMFITFILFISVILKTNQLG